MNEREAAALAAPITASALVLNCLVRFLEDRGVMERAEFIAYLSATTERLAAEGSDPAVLLFVRTWTKAIEADDPSGATH